MPRIYLGAPMKDAAGDITHFRRMPDGTVYDHGLGGIRKVGRVTEEGLLIVTSKYMMKHKFRLEKVFGKPVKQEKGNE